MANGTIGQPPAGLRAPQQPYAADPGTLIKWLEASAARVNRDGNFAVMAAVNAKYAQAADPAMTADQVTPLFKEMAEDILASECLESFLMVTTQEGGKPMVITVSRLS